MKLLWLCFLKGLLPKTDWNSCSVEKASKITPKSAKLNFPEAFNDTYSPGMFAWKLDFVQYHRA